MPTRSKPEPSARAAGSISRIWAISPPGMVTPAWRAPSSEARPRCSSEQLRVGLLDRDVVDHRDRLGADADEVVDVHRDAVDADRVVAGPSICGDQHLGADAVGGDREADAVGRGR